MQMCSTAPVWGWLTLLVIRWGQLILKQLRVMIHAHLLAIGGKSEIHRLCHELLQVESGEERQSDVVGEWASQRFGLTASVDTNAPNQIRFSDVPAIEHEINDDVQRLMQYVPKHDCSGFCQPVQSELARLDVVRRLWGGQCDTLGLHFQTSVR